MTDIVERLRTPVAWTTEMILNGQFQPHPVFSEAANEIERLRAEVAEYKWVVNRLTDRSMEIAAERDRLRELLRRSVAQLKEVIGEHADPDVHFYNECDKPGERCAWCEESYSIIAALKEGS